MDRFVIIVFVLVAIAMSPEVQATDCNGNRYTEKIFTEIEFIDNVIYARKQRSDGLWQNLGYDVYMPANDVIDDRPTIMLAHGGGYIDFIDQKSPDIVKLAMEFAQRGYVVFSVEYREEPNFLSLFNTENMVKAVGRALIDIRDVTCHLMDTTILHGNPYGVDPENVIVGGVSAGAVSFLHAVFLDSLAWIPEQYRDWILEVEPNTQALLDNKYCGANVKGIVNISGALLDTNWIKAYKLDEYPAMMHVHGGQDNIVPYGFDHPFGLSFLPKLMGSSLVHDKAQQMGLRSELDTYLGQGHVPILGVNWAALFTDNPIDIIFNPRILNATLRHMNDFCYSLIDCEPLLPTGLDEHKSLSLNFYPNPSRGSFTIDLPENVHALTGQLDIINSIGQVVHSKVVLPYEHQLFVQQTMATGLYQIRYHTKDSDRPFVGQLMIVQ